MALWKGAGVKVPMKGRWSRALCSRAEVTVFWDLNKCGVEDAEMEGDGEATVDASHIAPNIVKSLRSSGFSGPISIRAYGNTRSFSNCRVMQALLATGVDLHHTSGGMNYLSKHLILNLLLWARENSPPVHMLLISGDKEFSSVLHKLHMRGYDVLLAHPEGDISRHLLNAASKVWMWDKMMKGIEVSALSSKYNCLPQSNRSSNHTESQCCHNQEVQPELELNQNLVCHDLMRKPLNIPKRVVQQVLDIIRSRPSGFTVPAFRRQLVRSNVTLDKDLYGHKDLLSFLLSIPNLKARLIWTSDRTRTFFFTENLDGSTNLNNDSKEALSTSTDYSKDAKQEMLKAAQGKGHMKNVSCFQQFVDKLPIETSSKGSIAEVSSGVDLSPATKSPGFFSGGTNALSAVWNKTLSKLIALNFFSQFVGPTAAKTEKTFSKLPFTKKGREIKPKTEIINAESYISSCVSSPDSEEEKNSDLAYKNRLRKTIEGDRHKVVQHSTGYEALEDEQNRKSHLFRKSNVLASSDRVGTQQTRSGTNLGSEGQSRQCGLQNEVDAIPLLHEGRIAFTDARLTDELCEDVLLNEGSTVFTRSTSVDDVLKFLLERNLKGIAELKQEELIQLSKVCHEKIMLQLKRKTICNSKPKASKQIKVVKEKGSMSSSTSTDACRLTDKEGGIAVNSSQKAEKEYCSEESTIDKESLSIEQRMPEADVRSDISEGNVCSDIREADVRNDLKEMLLDSLQSFDNEVELVSVKPNFKARYGYELNNKALGYQSLTSLLSTLEEFAVIGRHNKKLILHSPERAVDKGGVEGGKLPS